MNTKKLLKWGAGALVLIAIVVLAVVFGKGKNQQGALTLSPRFYPQEMAVSPLPAPQPAAYDTYATSDMGIVAPVGPEAPLQAEVYNEASTYVAPESTPAAPESTSPGISIAPVSPTEYQDIPAVGNTDQVSPTPVFSPSPAPYMYVAKPLKKPAPPVVSLDASSPSGSRSVAAADNAFVFDVAANAQEAVTIRAALELTDGIAGQGGTCTPAADTDAGDSVDGSGELCTIASEAAGDYFTFDSGITDVADTYARANFWFKFTAVAGAAVNWADIALGTTNDNATAAVDQSIAFTQSACGADGTTAVSGEWYNCDIAIPVGKSERYLHIVLANIARLANKDTIHIDSFKLYNEKLTVDVTTDTDLDTYAHNNANAGAPSQTFLKEGGSTVATAYWDTFTNGASATTTGKAVFIPTTDIQIAKGTTKSFYLTANTSALLAEDAGSDDPVTFSIDLGASINGKVTAGDFWWYDTNTNATVKWLSQVANTTLKSNTLIY